MSLNRRDPRFPDLFSIDLASGVLDPVEENPGLAGFLTDETYRAVLALKLGPDGARHVLRKVDGTWLPFLEFAPEDARSSGPNHLDPAGKLLYLRDARGRDTAALARLDLSSGETTVLAADPRADIGGVIVDIETRTPRAYTVVVERLEYHALDNTMARDLDFLARSGIGDWALTSRTEDDGRWIVSANSDTRDRRWSTHTTGQRRHCVRCCGHVRSSTMRRYDKCIRFASRRVTACRWSAT